MLIGNKGMLRRNSSLMIHTTCIIFSEHFYCTTLAKVVKGCQVFEQQNRLMSHLLTYKKSILIFATELNFRHSDVLSCLEGSTLVQQAGRWTAKYRSSHVHTLTRPAHKRYTAPGSERRRKVPDCHPE